MISFALNDAGYGVISAVHGRDALNKLSITTADLVITDLDMPVMNGIDFIKQLRCTPEYSATPVIILTTNASESKRQAVKEAAASGWLVKPFSANYLVLVIKSFLRYRP
jgi:two-component system chemotaxis response regulator CheY